MATIFHIATRDDWEKALAAGRYEAPSLSTSGLIHCSDYNQVIRVANVIFRGQEGLLLLHVERERLSSPVVYENLDGGTELFPHVYGPIGLGAVHNVTPFGPQDDGSFDYHHSELAPRL